MLQKTSDRELAIASLTKLMTGLVAYNNSNLNGYFTLTGKDSLNVSPSLGLLSGDNVAALDIFNSMLIGSCNDAAVALADYTTLAKRQKFCQFNEPTGQIFRHGRNKLCTTLWVLIATLITPRQMT